MDYRGNTYYTIRNLSLYECQGWCREEPDCAAASFRFLSHLFFVCLSLSQIVSHDSTIESLTLCLLKKKKTVDDCAVVLLSLLFLSRPVLWWTLWRLSRRLCVCSRMTRPAPTRPSIRKSPSLLITWSNSTSDQVSISSQTVIVILVYNGIIVVLFSLSLTSCRTWRARHIISPVDVSELTKKKQGQKSQQQCARRLSYNNIDFPVDCWWCHFRALSICVCVQAGGRVSCL